MAKAIFSQGYRFMWAIEQMLIFLLSGCFQIHGIGYDVGACRRQCMIQGHILNHFGAPAGTQIRRGFRFQESWGFPWVV